MKIDIDRLTERDLIDLNHRIVERLKFLESMRAHSEMMRFSIGEKVCFSPPGHGELMGILVKYNRKSVTVLTEAGQKWNVSPHLLEAPRESKQRGSESDKIIELIPKKG